MNMARYVVQLVLLTGTILHAAKVDAKKTDIISDAARDEIEDIFLDQWTNNEPVLHQLIQAGNEKAEELNGACLMENSNTFYDPVISDCRHCSTCKDRFCYNKCYSYELEKRLDRQEHTQTIWSMVNTIALIVNFVIMVVFAVYTVLEQRRLKEGQQINKIQSPVADSDDTISILPYN